jgi:hypothetical protein
MCCFFSHCVDFITCLPKFWQTWQPTPSRQAKNSILCYAVWHVDGPCCAVLCYAVLQKPKTLDEAVDKLVALKLEDVRTGLTADYAAKAAALAARIEHLQQQQQQQAAQAAAAVSSANNSSHGGRASASSRLGSAGSRVASAKPTAS